MPLKSISISVKDLQEWRKIGRTETYFDHFYGDWFETIAVFRQTLHLVLSLVPLYIEFSEGAEDLLPITSEFH